MSVIQAKLHGYLAEVSRQDAADYFTTTTLRYSPKRRSANKYVKEYVPLYTHVDGKYYVGYGAIKYLIKNNPLLQFEIKLNDSLPFEPLEYPEAPEGLEYRWYQLKALELAQYERGGLFELPTASGKSVVEACIAVAASRQHNVLIIAPRIVIINSIIRAASKFGITVDYYDNWREREDVPTNGLVLISTSTPVNNDIKSGSSTSLLDSIGTLLLDEGHHLSSDTWYALQFGIPSLVRCFAFSATSLDTKRTPSSFTQLDYEDAMVYAGSGPMLLRIRPKEIREYLNCPTVINVDFSWGDSLHKYFTSNHWRTIQSLIRSYPGRLEFISKLAVAAGDYGHRLTIPVSQMQYGDHIYETINHLGGRCATWYGGQSITDPEGNGLSESELIKRLVDGDIRQVVMTQHGDEGLDIPEISGVILTEGRRSRTQIQRAGRSARPGTLPSIVINVSDVDQVTLRAQARDRSKAISEYYETPVYNARTYEDFVHILSKRLS